MRKESKKNMLKLYLQTPDYERPILEVPEQYRKKILKKLSFLYGDKQAKKCFAEVERLMQVHYAHKTPEMIAQEKEFKPGERFSENDVILITYGDLIQSKERPSLEILTDFARRFLKGVINTIHILPFFPYSSDRGFSVINFEEVDPVLGNWENITALSQDFKLMFDGVFNHVSSKNKWFQEFLNSNPRFSDFFISFPSKEAFSKEDLQLVLRPRTSDLLTQFSTLNGTCYVWTTFSADQIDLNYKNPEVLLQMIDILFQYVRRGADLIRLDAVTYLWKEPGTRCVHLEQTHTVIKLFRDLLDVIAPPAAIITETNVPHKENVQYFGNGGDEAQMVYNFALPPLTLHAFQNASAARLTKWASTLNKVSDKATYFNFLDSHDGIGVMGAMGILSKDEIKAMALKVIEHGGLISYKTDSDGAVSPYELNITWYSALNREDTDETSELQINRFLASRSIALALMGVPGIYLHGLLGSGNDTEAVMQEGGDNRSINRSIIDRDSLYNALADRNTRIFKISARFMEMIKKRIREKAFHPNATQQVLDISDAVFALIRTSSDGEEKILCLTNVTDNDQQISFKPDNIGSFAERWCDILSGVCFNFRQGFLVLNIKPYEVLWLKELCPACD